MNRTFVIICSLALFLSAWAVVGVADERANSAIDSAKTKNSKSQSTATIEGTITYKADPKRPWRYSRYYVDKKNNRLAEALICLRVAKTKTIIPTSKKKTAIIDQKDFRFIPETLAIRVGDEVKFTNSDFSVHNVSSSNELHPFDLSLGNGDEAIETFSRAGGPRRPVSIGCKFHGSMRAWIYVFDHPWFLVTGTDGRFQLQNVPPGVYRLEMIHSAGRLRWTKRIEVSKGQTFKFDITVSSENKLKPKR